MLVAHVHIDHFLPLVVAHDFAGHRRPAPEVVGRIQHLQRAGVAFLHQTLDVAGVELARGQLFGQELRRAFHPAAACAAQVADVQRGRFAVEMAHGQGDAAQVLEGVVRGEHAVQVGAARQHRALRALEVLGVQVHALAAFQPGHAGLAPLLFIGAVGVLHFRQVELGQLAVAFLFAAPGVAGQHGIVQAGAVVAAGRGKDARGPGLGGGLGIGPLGDELLGDALGVAGHGVVGLVLRLAGQQRGLGQLLHDVGEVVAVQAGGRQHHVHARAAQLFARHQAHAGNAPARIPHRLHAQQPQRLRFQQAEVAHGLHRPQAEGEFFWGFAVQLAVFGKQVFGGLLARFPRLLGGHARGVKAVEVAPRGVGIGVLDGVAAVGGGQVLAIQHGQQAGQLALGTQVGVSGAGLLQRFLQRLGQVVHGFALHHVALQELVGRGLRQLFPGADQGFIHIFQRHTGVRGGGFPKGLAQHQQHGA